MQSFSASQWVPVAVAASRLGVSRQRVYELIKTGGLSWCKMGSLVLVGAKSIQMRLLVKGKADES